MSPLGDKVPNLLIVSTIYFRTCLLVNHNYLNEVMIVAINLLVYLYNYNESTLL